MYLKVKIYKSGVLIHVTIICIFVLINYYHLNPHLLVKHCSKVKSFQPSSEPTGFLSVTLNWESVDISRKTTLLIDNRSILETTVVTLGINYLLPKTYFML